MKSQMKLKKNKWGTIHVDLQVLQVTRGSLTNDIGLWCLESATDLTTVYYYGLIQVLRRSFLYLWSEYPPSRPGMQINRLVLLGPSYFLLDDSYVGSRTMKIFFFFWSCQMMPSTAYYIWKQLGIFHLMGSYGIQIQSNRPGLQLLHPNYLIS